MDKKLIYDSLLNEHRRVSNQISEIKGENFEMNESQQKRIKELEKRQIHLMNQMRVLFNGK